MQSFIRVWPGRLLLVVAGLFLGVMHAPSGVAQTPTAEQIEIFQNLPPDQQQAILEAMGRSGDSRVLDQTGTGTRQDERTGTMPGADQRVGREEVTRDRTALGEPRLAPDDTLIVEILPLEWEGQERILTPRPEAATQRLLPGVQFGTSQQASSDGAGAGNNDAETRGRESDRAQRRRIGEPRAADGGRAPRQPLPDHALRHARPARIRADPGRRVDRVPGHAAADRRAPAAGFPDTRDAAAARACAQALRLRPVHRALLRPLRPSGTSRFRPITWSDRATASRCSSSATPRRVIRCS